jgi:hypothetical protein
MDIISCAAKIITQLCRKPVVVKKDDLKNYRQDPQTGNLIISLNQ